MIKLIASDMDGTLLNDDHVISERNLEAIKAAQDEGIIFMIATGREYGSIHTMMKERGFVCPCILVNGAQICDVDGQAVKSIELAKEKVKRLVQVICDYRKTIHFMTNCGSFIVGSREDLVEDWLERSQYFNPGKTREENLTYMEESHFFDQIRCLERIEEIYENPEIEVYKLESFYPDAKVVRAINEKLKEIPGVAVASAGPYSIEVTDAKAQKGTILADYVQELGIHKEEVAVFGDSLNDHSMFVHFPYSFAPENAMKEIKELAYRVVESNHEDGVGNEIFRLLGKGKDLCCN